MDARQELRRMGIPEAVIATATERGKPLAEVEKRSSQLPDGMNKTEARYAAELDWLKRENKVVNWWFASVKFRLAKRTWYTPDFLVLLAGGVFRFVEIKGFLRDDAAVKFKLAREKYPWAEWLMLRRSKSGWERVNV